MIKSCNTCGDPREVRKHCKPCRKIYRKRYNADNKIAIDNYNHGYYKENTEACKERSINNYNANPDAHIAKSTHWRLANPEASNASFKKYRDNNPDKRAELRHNRRALKNANSDGTLNSTSIELLKLLATDCIYCSVELNKANMAIDHVHPISKGGANSLFNIRIICRKCNNKKSAKSHQQFISEQDAPVADIKVQQLQH